jgi:hypothetical protein
LTVGLVQADILNGKLKSIDATKNQVVVTSDGKDFTIDVPKDAKISKLAGKSAKKAVPSDIPEGISGLSTGVDVQVSYTKKDGKDVAESVRMIMIKKKK